MGVTGNGLALPIVGEGFLPDGVYISHVQLYGGVATDYERQGDSNQNIDTGTYGALVTDSQSDIPVLWAIEATSDAPISVIDVWTQVDVAFTASVTLSIGDSDDAGLYGVSSDMAIMTTTNVISGPGDTILRVSSGSGVFGKKRYTATGQILGTLGGADPATGLVNVYIMYAKHQQDRRFA